jgi:tetratricopeptide (TPR) repeat protein
MVIRLLILLLGGVYVWISLASRSLTSPPVKVGLPILAFLGVALVSTIASPYTDQSVQWLIVLAGYALFLALLVFFVKRWDHAVKLLTVFMLMALGEAVYALTQKWSGMTPRPSGTFFNPNFLAVYLAVAWVMVVAYLCYDSRKLSRPCIKRSSACLSLPFLLRWVVPMSVLVVLLSAIVSTGSRGGVLVVLVGTAVVLSIRFGRRSVMALLVFFLAMLLLPNPLRDRIWAEHQINPEAYARWQMWGQSVLEMADHPLGIGLGLYQYAAPRYMFPIEGQIVRYAKIATTAHNEYLQMGVELGIISLPIFVWGLYLVGREARRALIERMHRSQRGLLVGLVAATVTLLSHASVDSTFHEPALALLLTVCVALLLSARRLIRPESDRPPAAIAISSRPVWAVISIGLFAVMTGEILRLGLAWQAYELGSKAAVHRDYPRAIAGYRTAVELDPGKAFYHNALASGYFQLFERTKEVSAAEASVRELHVAISLNPLDGRLAALLGHVCTSLINSDVPEMTSAGRRALLFSVARAAYEQAEKLEPYVPFYRLELGRLALAMGERTVAESWVRGAVDMEPNFLPGREWLSRLYLASGRVEEANRQVTEIRTRQQRYAAWTKDPLETRFLKADTAALEAALAGAAPPA